MSDAPVEPIEDDNVALEPIDELAALAEAVDGIDVERDVSSADFCTYRVGGPLALLVRVSNMEALAELAEAAVALAVPTLALGRGSNLLVADEGFDGLAIHLVGTFGETTIDDCTVVAGGAAALPVVARATVAAGLTGFEWAVGVPGSIGGAVRMNAGGHGSDMSESVTSVQIADLHLGGLFRRDASSLAFGYRHSAIAPWEIVASATIELEYSEGFDSAQMLSDIVAWRREHQPGGANAGSVFTNPPDDSAGRLIDVTGLKGLRIGTAEVSEKHANFIQADPGGAASDVYKLMAEVARRVEDKTGVRLQAETHLVGFDDHPTGKADA
ncbi:MAG: UDP-N-acetylmuramate dehydrogenase [Acidimicrobiales bacterium]|nr:UDP-N-acetylmuramate dehydrogenase [Acidimicrobiales bacterium]